MHYTTLGRTGLKVSVAGLGCGGASRLGMAGGASRGDAARLVRHAIDLGVNVIDTARLYGTEGAVGDALKGMPRDSVVVATKHLVHSDGHTHSPAEVVAGLDTSLRELGLDYVDIFYIHGLTLQRWDHAINHVLPALRREQEKGKFRFLGATEAPHQDPCHDATVRGIDKGLFDVVMLAFSILNQNARDVVFPKSMANRVGTMLMFVVRQIFADPDLMRATIRKLAVDGELPAAFAAKDEPLDFLVHAGGAGNLLDAAYRYGRHEPGADVVLFGTGSAKHMEQNIASILAPPLPENDRATVRALFGKLVGIGLENHALAQAR